MRQLTDDASQIGADLMPLADPDEFRFDRTIGSQADATIRRWIFVDGEFVTANLELPAG